MINLLVLKLCSEIVWDPNETNISIHSYFIQGVTGSSKTLAANISRSYCSRQSGNTSLFLFMVILFFAQEYLQLKT
jgi:hypothetical protein